MTAAPELADRCQVIENPLSEVFTADPDAIPLPGHVVAIGTAANKNLEATIAACSTIEGVSLTVVGVMTEQQREFAERLGVPVTQLSGISDEELASLYRSAAVVSFPSTAEGFGLPIIEAQGCGTPVVTSDLPPMNHIANGAALLVDPDDHHALASALNRAISREEDIDRMVEAGLRNATERDSARIAQRYNDVYRSLSLNIDIDACLLYTSPSPRDRG